MDPKAELRRVALLRRDAQPNHAGTSARVLARLEALPEFGQAATVCWYVGIRSEVATLPAIERGLAAGRPTVVPVCRGAELELWRLAAIHELHPAGFGLLEPPLELRTADRHVPPDRIDLFVVPGVVFDRRGARLGYGRGFYDRLLAGARPDARKVGLAFDCQLVDAVPQSGHDIAVDLVITESAIYRA
jgi:5-formyltetrahydrofolate cyclo-ligase